MKKIPREPNKQISLIDSINEIQDAQKGTPLPCSERISLKELSIRLRKDPDFINKQK